MHTVYFVTNRKANRKKGPDDFGPEFSEESIDDLRLYVPAQNRYVLGR